MDELDQYIEAITDVDFIEWNYGISDIDIQFIKSFDPRDIIQDYEDFNLDKE